MDELQKLYDLLVREGKYTKSFDDFKTKWGSEQGYQDKVFEVVSRDGFYTKDKNSFLSKYGMPAEEVKKKEGLVLPPSPSPSATDLPLGIGSLEYAKPTKPVAPVQEGPSEKLSVGPMGMVGLERTKEYVPAKDQGKQGTILNTVSSLDKGFYKNLIGSPVKGLGTLLEGVTGKGFVSDALIKFGDYFNKTIDELTPQDEEFKNSLTDQFGQAFGQVASLVATGGATGALGKGATAAGAAEAALAAQTAPTAVGVGTALKTLGSELASPTAVSAGLSMGQGEFERAKQAGATDEQAFEAFYKNAAVGSILEKIPVMQFLKRFEKASAGGISNYIKTKGVAGLTGGIEEMTTEVLQGIYANLTAQDIYDANQQMFDGIGEAGGVGFGVGFLLNAMGANVKILRSQGREEEAQVVENQIAEFESQAAKGGKSSYKMGGVKIESPEIISNMIDNMSAADLTKANIEIENDPELNNKLQNKIITSSVKEQVRQGNPDLNEASLDAITNLELELRKLEGNTTQTGKDKAAAIRSQIKNIQENQLTEEVDNSARIAELEGILSSADRNLAETGFTSLSQDARVEIEKELQTLKTKQDVQKQTASQVPVQSGTEDSGKMEEGKPQAKPQGVAEEGGQAEVVQEEVTPELTQQEQDIERNRLNDKVFEAKKNIARAEDTEAAIEEYNVAKKELDDFEASVEANQDKRRAKLNVESIVEDEKTFYQRAGYEYKELYDQDPRLAALQSAKDMVGWLESGESEKAAIARGENPEEAKKSIERSLKANKRDIADLQADLEANPAVSLKTQEEVAPVTEVEPVTEAAPVTEAVLEVEQYEPITEKQVSHEKKFNKNTAIDYEEDTRETDSGREVTYLSRVTVEALDDNTGDAIGGLTKIVDEDKNVSWQALDVDGNELGKEDFDSLEEAKAALVKHWNKIQKKEFDKEAKRKAKATEKEAAKKAKAEAKKPKFVKDETVRPEPTGDRTGRTESSTITPLEGAPSVPGVNGPDPQLVAVAEQYAKANGIPFKRQAEYVKVDEKRAKRIADAYEAMANDPQNPKVKEAYQNLIKQTIAQYKALVDAGYKFWFMDLNIPSNAEYASTPYNAIRDLRKNKEMGVFPTTDGYGDGGLTELDVENNPMLADTGLQWPVGGLNGEMKTVLANDLFRAVHDAFGHGLEGAGFRARGEENAWQAHVRLFTGSAIAAITSETRGQNSWLNYGPNGEQNKNAKVEDTIFAEQKVGLMPKWTWTEGRAADMEPAPPKRKQKAAPIVEEEGPTDEDLSAIDALLDLDVENEDNMQIVLNALDKANKALNKRLFGQANNALLAIPLNVVSVVIKALKAAVKGGMLLRDAIRKVSAENNLSQQIVKDILNVSEIQEGFDALMVKVDEMIARQTRRGTPEARMVSNIDTLVRNSEVYQNANDAQKKILEREARARAGVSARRAPSIGRILGVLKDITNVSRQDKLAIISKIRQLSKDAAKDLAAEIKELAKGGKITANQAANIVSRFGKVNMLSEISVSKFVDYMTKVFNDAEYASKLSKAKSTKKELSSLSRNKDKNANLRDLAQQFIKIDPAMVEDIDAYNDMASKIKESIKGSTIRGQKVSFAETVNIDNATEYINKTLNAQLEAMKAEKAAEIQSLMGIDVSDFSYEDMMMLLESDKPITKYNEGIIRDTINKAFSVFSSIIKESISTGKDPFTGEDVKFTESQKDVVKRFMAMDLNILKPKEALQAVDALANFLQNQSTAKMEAVVSKYTGIANAAEVNEKEIVASPLKKYWSKTIGRILGEQTTNLNVLFERMFKGFNKGGFVMDKMGLTKLINKKSFAQKQANNIVDTYVEKFYKLKANGEAFNSAYNNIERGMAAFMMRNVIGTEQEMKAEFSRRKNLMEESISALEKGNEKERERAKLYQQAYDNILKDSENIDDIKKKTDKVNLDGIDFWMNEWANKFEQLSDVSENVYNKILDKDINYTPDRFYKLSSDTGTVEIGDDDSAFIANSGLSNLYQRATGVLMTAVRPETLPVNPESGDVNRYIDLSFDNNNSNSMYDALVDINTAAPIRQIQAFLNSSDFKKIVPTSEDAKILKDRIQLYVRNIRDKNPYSNDELSSVVRKLNKIAAIGVGQALGGITQPIKQVIPVAINTLINGGGLDLSAAFNQAKNAFINNSGYAIASRGLESQAQIESLNKLIDEVSETKGEKLMAGIEKLNKWWLDKFLVKPDVFIARASWLTYYEKYLKDNGLYGTTIETKTPSGKIEVTTEGIDYNTHQLNEDAANYAQRMVDRQQNVSDTDLAGKLFASRESANQLLVKTLMPFASFRMNQSARLGADLATLTNKTSTKEDKKVALRSVAGFASEMVTFRLVSIGISVLLGSLAKEIMGVDEDDEEKQKRIDNIVKGAKTGTFTDIFSPVPIADKLVQAGGALITQSIEDATGLPTAIYSPKKEEFLQNAGLFGIAADRAAQLWEISNLATTGEYTDDFGKEKTISSDSQEGLSFLIPAAILTNVGLAPSEVNTVVRYAIKDSKKSRKSSQEKAEKAERKADTEETKKQKLDAFENVKQETSDPAVLDAINEKISELKATAEQKKEIERKNKAERVLKQSLLVDPETGEEYDTETEMKRYNKDLWEKNFGENSEWYLSHEAEKEATKLLNKEIRKMEDEEYNYVTPTRKSKRARNSDGTFKRKRREL